MKCCEIEGALLFLHGRRQLTWLAPTIRHGLLRIVRVRSWQIAEDQEAEQMELGTSGPAMVHCVERGGQLLKIAEEVQAKGQTAWVFELEGHGSAGLATKQAWLPQMVYATRPLVCWRWSGHERHASTKR